MRPSISSVPRTTNAATVAFATAVTQPLPSHGAPPGPVAAAGMPSTTSEPEASSPSWTARVMRARRSGATLPPAISMTAMRGRSARATAAGSANATNAATAKRVLMRRNAQVGRGISQDFARQSPRTPRSATSPTVSARASVSRTNEWTTA